MTTARAAQHQLRDLTRWAPLLNPLADSHLGLHSPTLAATHTRTRADLAAKLARIPNPDDGAHGVTTHTDLTTWAAAWATVAGLSYTGSPLHALADNAPTLKVEWNDWDSFTDDLQILHARIARATGHTPRVIGPCPVESCSETVTQAQTKHGAEGPLECPRGHTYATMSEYRAATITSDQRLIREAESASILITISEFLRAWPELTRDDIKNWTKERDDGTKRLTTHKTRRGKSIPLGPANTLARQLIAGREHRSKRE